MIYHLTGLSRCRLRGVAWLHGARCLRGGRPRHRFAGFAMGYRSFGASALVIENAGITMLDKLDPDTHWARGMVLMTGLRHAYSVPISVGGTAQEHKR